MAIGFVVNGAGLEETAVAKEGRGALIPKS
jgi:hypothetical protein